MKALNRATYIALVVILLSVMTEGKVNGKVERVRYTQINELEHTHLVQQTKIIQVEDIREVIFKALQGLQVYSFIMNGEDCVKSLDTFSKDLETMIDSLYQAFSSDITNRALYETAVFSFTDALGRFSPMFRKCYQIGGEIDKNWQIFVNQTSTFYNFYQMVRTNVERNWTDLDNRGYSLYQSITTVNLP